MVPLRLGNGSFMIEEGCKIRSSKNFRGSEGSDTQALPVCDHTSNDVFFRRELSKVRTGRFMKKVI